MILATTTVEGFDRFKEIFSTKGLEKRKEHGSKGATVFRDPNEDDRVWMLYDSADGGTLPCFSRSPLPTALTPSLRVAYLPFLHIT